MGGGAGEEGGKEDGLGAFEWNPVPAQKEGKLAEGPQKGFP